MATQDTQQSDTTHHSPLTTHPFEPYALKFVGIYRDYIWGGERLRTVLGKETPEGQRVAESWEVADHPQAMSVVRNGAYAGMRIDALRERFGKELIGERGLALGRGRLPLLIKFLDCQNRLSVQVHPDDAYGAQHENGSLGKTEMWYVVASDPGSGLWCGLKPGVDRAALEQAIAEGRLADTLQEIAVDPGDCFFIPAGRVHALGEGLIVCEIQQNSDVTYRLYDWDRAGADGKPRELHVEKALDVIDYAAADPHCQPAATPVPGGTIERLVTCPQFITDKVSVTGLLSCHTHQTSFHTLSAVMGEGYVRVGASDPEPLRMGETVLIPCAAGAYDLESAGDLVVLRGRVP